MSDNDLADLDLWGNEVYRTVGKRGRPPFERTDENASKVSMLLAMGWSNDRIASVIRDPRTGTPISVPTLKRHFRSELKLRLVARDQMVARQLMQSWEQADKGNVGAMRFFETLRQKNDMMAAEEMMGQTRDRAAAARPKPGKKEVNQQAALDADAALEAELEREADGARRH